MIRPLVEATYDYHMNVAPNKGSDTFANLSQQSNYRTQYIEACQIIGADSIAEDMATNSSFNLSEAINRWNSRHDEMRKQVKKESKSQQLKIDYKSKLDAIFKDSGKKNFKPKQSIVDGKMEDVQHSEPYTYQKPSYHSSNQNYSYHNQTYVSKGFSSSYSSGKSYESKYRQNDRQNDRY